MQSNYKSLGDYIKRVDKRNLDLKVTKLYGLSMTKEFRESTSNIVGTDMTKYKVMEKHQFACDFMSPIRVSKLPVVLKLDEEQNLVSPAYPVFEVRDKNALEPEYLMMWFRRPEFDRYVTFKCDAAIRGGFDWDELCQVKLPIPSIQKQREIVAEFNTIKNRIELNNQLIHKLEETAQAIYKQWFVDFEFPDEKGKPYKSSGGKMVFNKELDKEIPEGWENGNLSDVSQCLDFKRKPLSEIERLDFKGNYPYYGAMGIVDYVKEYLFDGEYILFSEDGVNVIDEKGHPSVFFIWGKFWVNNHAHILDGKNGYSVYFILLSLKNANVSDLVTGAAQPKINQENMNSIKLVIPFSVINERFHKLLTPIYESIKVYSEQIEKLIEMKTLLLSKLATMAS